MTKFRNLPLQRKIAEQPCMACGIEPAGAADHILTVGSRPDLATEVRNMWPLCNIHHKEKEKSLPDFVEKYHLKEELYKRDFFYIEYNNKWRYGGDLER